MSGCLCRSHRGLDAVVCGSAQSPWSGGLGERGGSALLFCSVGGQRGGLGCGFGVEVLGDERLAKLKDGTVGGFLGGNRIGLPVVLSSGGGFSVVGGNHASFCCASRCAICCSQLRYLTDRNHSPT